MTRKSRYPLAFAIVIMAVLLALVPTAGAATHGTKADAVYIDGNIYTVNKAFDRVSAMAIKDGRFLAVGSDSMMRGFIGRDTEVVDLDGMTVLPGLIESHMHYLMEGETAASVNCFWKPKDEIIHLVGEACAAAQPGEWVQGQGWNQEVWVPPVFPTAADLDPVSGDVPVVLFRTDWHAIWCNSAAMTIAGIDDSTPNPEGGEIVRDAAGHATGVLIDAAMDLVTAKIPPYTERQEIEAAKLAQAELFSYGITSCVDQGSGQQTIELLKRLYSSGDLKIRIRQMVSVADAEKYYDQPKSERVGLFGDRYTIDGIKILEDGALGSRGAWLLEDYLDQPGWTGLPQYTANQLYTMAREARLHGFQVATHAIGDAAVRTVLDAYERVENELPRLNKDPRFRVEHASLISPQDVPRFAALKVIPSFQPVFVSDDYQMVVARVGEQRAQSAYIWRTMLNTGVVTPSGSDAPVDPVNPFIGMYAAVTRTDFRDGNPPGGWHIEQAMTKKEALRSFTIWGAYASFSEKQKGSIEKGKLADFVVVDRDYLSCPALRLKDITAQMTVLGGEIVYSVPDFGLDSAIIQYDTGRPMRSSAGPR